LDDEAMSKKYAIRPDLEEFVTRLVESGRYLCAAEVISDGLDLLKDQEVAREARRAELLASIDAAMADIDANGGIPAEDVFAEMEELIRSKESRDAAE
jgi:putative addiction module CopG family antidote